MSERNLNSHESIDRATSTSICKAIGERLRQNMAPESSDLPPALQRLLEEMDRQDSDPSRDHS